jgi:uncharacterized protein YlxW (UPF0749 family)
MSLLVDISTEALDPAYAEAAARRADDPRRGRPGPGTVVGVLATALLVAIAAVQAHARAPAAARSRADLVRQAQQQLADVAGLEREANGLRDQVAALRDRTLASSAAGQALARRLGTEELLAGAAAASGPGLRVRLDDATTGSSSQRNRVQDGDLQAVVNALWAAGAEAVAINGHRLTGQSAIRQAGEAILVNFTPLSAPYVVDAVGDPVHLATAFGASAAAARMRDLVQLYGLRFGYSRVARILLPAAPDQPLRYAHPLGTAR